LNVAAKSLRLLSFDSHLDCPSRANSATMSLGYYKCFESNLELRSAVINYTTLDGSPTGPMATTYGYPLASWCVDDVTDFSGIFQDLAEFNEYQLANWSVPNAVDMSNMVR
jgi:Mycoplasma protein of unknown function, DUF285